METATRRLRIGISGSYGGMNLGDEAILEGILGQLRADRPRGHHRLLPEPRGHAGQTQGRARRRRPLADPDGR